MFDIFPKIRSLHISAQFIVHQLFRKKHNDILTSQDKCYYYTTNEFFHLTRYLHEKWDSKHCKKGNEETKFWFMNTHQWFAHSSLLDILHLFCIKCTNFIRDRESLRTTKSYTILLGWYWNQWSYWICNFQHHACDSRMCIGCHAWLLFKLVVRYTRLWSLSNLHCSFTGNYFKRNNILVRNKLVIAVCALTDRNTSIW